jgi:hypothetical protein
LVYIADPPPIVTPHPQSFRIRAGTELVRIYDPGPEGFKGYNFRFIGPKYRFDHHATTSTGRGILYCAQTLSCCLAEKFGDYKLIEYKDNRRLLFRPSRDLQLLDLVGVNASKAGTVAAISMNADTVKSQSWSRYFYENPSTYGEIDGLRYMSAHNAEIAIALYERAADAVSNVPAEDDDLPLSDPSLRLAILEAADANNLVAPP